MIDFKSQITEDEWSEWLDSPTTQIFMNLIQAIRQDELELISGSADFVSYARQDGRYMMMCDLLDTIKELKRKES